MKITQIASIVTAMLASVSAIATPKRAAEAEYTAVKSGNAIFYGQAANPDGAECTRCVGHHGLCTIGDGSCYAPDGCYFCGGCGADRARCQDPNSSEGCQCY